MRSTMQHSVIRRVAAIGTYVPRKCGIATFTDDVCSALAGVYPNTDIVAMPINDRPEGYRYPGRVRFEIDEEDIDSYKRAADFLNINNVDVVSLQHEFGIFGGVAGSHVVALLRELRMPVVTTLHTVLKDPNPQYRAVMDEIAQLSERLVVMSEKGRDFLLNVYNIAESKIDFIHHGIPDTPFVDPNFYKDQFGVEGRSVLLTFGLLSPGKGLEFAIRALPGIVAKHPEVVYLIVGATHPHEVAHNGESYRVSLEMLAEELGVRDNLIFYNRFVDLEELIEFIGAADIYLTPYLNAEQITSGTLAYTLGSGKAVVSTPYWYAQELLADNRGRLVPFKEPDAMAQAVNDLLGNEVELNALRKRAYLFGRDMVWPVVARRYMESFQLARERRQHVPGKFRLRSAARSGSQLPAIKLDHLTRMTDNVGIIRSARVVVPQYGSGYSTQDNAMALVATVMLKSAPTEIQANIDELSLRYIAFLVHAWDQSNQRFHNVLRFDRRWEEDHDFSEETHGMALWALGCVLGRSRSDGLSSVAGSLFEPAMVAVEKFTSLRAMSLALIGIQEYFLRFSGDRKAQQVREQLAGHISQAYESHSDQSWQWFEPSLTYYNAIIPKALLMAGRWTDNGKWIDQSITALRWLAAVQRSADRIFAPVGSDGFYSKDGDKARFDQQPIEAYMSASAYLEAWRASEDPVWRSSAIRAFEWFVGRNDLQAPLYDPSTGGCRQAIEPGQINADQSAKATLSFLLSLLEIRSLENVIDPHKAAGTPAPTAADGSVPAPELPQETLVHRSGA